MSSPGFTFLGRGSDKSERLEMDRNNNVLKKYGGTNTSWPIHSKVQMAGQSHKEQQSLLKDVNNNIADFFNNTM